MPDRLLYPIREACQLLGIGKSTLYKLSAEGRIKIVKIGNRALVLREECERFAAEIAAEAKALHNH